MKSATRGYGTLDYDFIGYEPADLVKLDILVASKRVDALSTIVHRKDADIKGRKLVKSLRTKSHATCLRLYYKQPSEAGLLQGNRSVPSQKM